MDWIRKFYNDARQMGATLGQKMPDFDTFWKKGYLLFPVSEENRNYVSFADFRADPKAHPLSTESGKIQLFSPKIAGYHYNDCLGHPTYFQPTEGVAAATDEVGQTRGHSLKARATQSRKRESRGSKTLWRGQGAAPLGSLK